MRILYLTSADEDLAKGFHVYENKDRALAPTSSNQSKRFPYAIYYTVEENTASVWAALDCRQDPATIVTRLKSLR